MVDIEKLKNSTDSDIKIWGSSKLVQPLLKDDLVDEFWLNVHPLLLGKGKKLFDKYTTPTAFKLIDSCLTPNGVIMTNYKRAGKVKMGTVRVIMPISKPNDKLYCYFKPSKISKTTKKKWKSE